MDYKHLDRHIKLGLNIAYYRGLRNITQEQLAEHLDGAATHISKIERGIVGVSLDRLFDIADYLKVEPSKFLEFRD